MRDLARLWAKGCEQDEAELFSKRTDRVVEDLLPRVVVFEHMPHKDALGAAGVRAQINDAIGEGRFTAVQAYVSCTTKALETASTAAPILNLDYVRKKCGSHTVGNGVAIMKGAHVLW